MVNPIKKVFFDLIDKSLTLQGEVISVCKWKSSEIYEIKVHLPTVDMQKWNFVPRIKIKVADYVYRDYSPALWNAAEKTCYLFIDAKHVGVGSSWTRSLKVGQYFLFAPASAASLPKKEGPILCVGDESALGHFLALKQLSSRDESPMQMLLSIAASAVIPNEMTGANEELICTHRTPGEGSGTVQHDLSKIDLSSFRSIYLAGNMSMVQRLRKCLKNNNQVDARIVANGFWS